MMPAWAAALAIVLLLAVVRQAPPAADVTVTARAHHLRIGDAREWTEFPERAEGPALVVTFEATANPRERTLRLRHRDLKQDWRVQVNGREVAKLAPDEADAVTYWAIPPNSLRDGANELRVTGTGNTPDDVLIGPATIVDRSMADLLAEATVDVSVHEDPGGAAIPSRLTIADERGTLMGLGTASDATHAVRPGVVYSASGSVRLSLPAGRYVIYAGRGFEYGVARVTVDLAPGTNPALRLAIRREVDTAGWAAMDTHVHTATYARHGDATIAERMLTLAGEGIELPVSTEHNTRIDFDATARAAGVRDRFTPILGTEVTTPALGHFNVFPLPADGVAIDQRAADWVLLRRSILAAADRPVIVLNHARDVHGGFRPIDGTRSIGQPGDHPSAWPLPADAMEIVNSGAVLADGLRLPLDWMALLSDGRRLTPVGSSDSHDVARYIVGQGRTYVRCDDRRPGAIDTAAALESVRRGRVLVSYGLLTELEVNGRGPGELVGPRRALSMTIRVKGPAWTAARRVALFVDGVQMREQAIPDGTQAGVKWEATWRLAAPNRDASIVVVATGPGVTAPYWPMAKPYQPTSPDFTPYVLGVSGAVYVDADGTGDFDGRRLTEY